MGKILEIDLRIHLYQTPEKNIFVRYIPKFFSSNSGYSLESLVIKMKDSLFHGDNKEKDLEYLKDLLDGDSLMQEILESFENFDRLVGNEIQELFPLEDDL
ncbi:hypothetical protein LEP1GSC067_0419 [Leptospira interrogans serovar Lora str. TE 1992]|uniref:Uncharacterized protein n=2 Tax=Leptospira interrogans TaxID=173 RepID=M3EWG3_LEPIR|nr:hypothetical protein LEP1GSC067_0419 [Leptospira interrogans serovar Lora str. TE 1992]